MFSIRLSRSDFLFHAAPPSYTDSLLIDPSLEATGVYWKPVWNILEAEKKFALLLVNAQHVKRVPGRKTDQKDSEWIGELLQHGLLRASFVPPVEIRQLRDLTRMRAGSGRPWLVLPIASRRYWKTPTSSWVRWPVTYWESLDATC